MEFDFIVVGAGSAGCVLANRLSANPKNRVALLEAGGRDMSPWIHIPIGYFKTMGNPKTDWCYYTQPDPGLNGRSIAWPRGKTLGGSSAINGLLYVRGQPQDFDRWRQLGNHGWGWDDVLPFFKRAENWEGVASEHRGTNGLLHVSESRVVREIVNAWVDAAERAGYPHNNDYNSGCQEGVGYFQMTMQKSRRSSSATAYLKPIRNRKNLSIITHTQVDKVVFDANRAVAVECRIRGVKKRITTKAEIVLAAGAIGSPQLLMLSGIGASSELVQHGIDPLVDLPGVGKNLQDHLQARPVFKCTSSTINTEIKSIFQRLSMAAEYAITGGGPMAMAASLGTAFLRTKPELETPNIQFHIQPFSADKPGDGSHTFSAFTTSVLQLRPESKGHLELCSARPDDHPAIHPNYLATATDCKTIVQGIKVARSICEYEPLKSLITGEYSPGPCVDTNDDVAILEWARNTATTIYHPTGTCKMGSDNMAVVNDKLLVHGVDGLRVADASIMPTITSGNTNAPAIMIGEKASDIVLKEAVGVSRQ